LKLDSKYPIQKIKELLEGERQNIVIVSHRNPDGDAMGSSLALYNYFIKMGHEVNVVVPNAFAGFLKWLPESSKAMVYDYMPEKCNEILKKGSILFAVDFNDLSRIKEFEQNLVSVNSYKVLIDHHPNPGNFADLSIVDTSVSSSSELIYLFLKSLDNDKLLDKDIAECIYAGIMTDTGCFSFNSSNRQTFEVVAELLDLGIDKDDVYDRVFDNYSYDRMKLLGHCLQENMVVIPEYKTAYISLSQAEMKRFNFKVGDSEGFVNIPLSIKGVVFSVLFSERDDVVKLSLRSKGKFAVNKMAQEYFSGGGHANASGGESTQSLENSIKTFIGLLPKYKEDIENA
jgi:bifunctional oligoribonuclease and PAP phosphatase NrnA